MDAQDAAPSVPTEAAPTEDTLPSLSLLIIAKGEEVRKLRASGEAETAAASVKELLGLKAHRHPRTPKHTGNGIDELSRRRPLPTTSYFRPLPPQRTSYLPAASSAAPLDPKVLLRECI